jgi:ATPase subunit of ABC transporter with duplicated ATPase domains
MITLDKVTMVIHGNRILFDGVTLTFNPGSRVGLTGPNGSGKSTLMRIIMGVQEPTSGSVTLPKKVGFLRQNLEEFHHMRVIDAVIMGNSRLWKALQERDHLYEVEMSDEVGMRLGELEEIVAEENGYSAEAEAASLLDGMHVPGNMHEYKMAEIPTDMQFRVLLCQALFGSPEALLLDEPTNHLDLESITWLEDFLRDYQGALVVTSHDRHFLNAITTEIADIDYETIIMYPGNYDTMVVAKTSVRAQAEQEAKSKEKKIAKLQEFVAKFGAGTRASQVQSRMKEMDRLKPEELKKSNIERPYVRFCRFDKRPGATIFKVENLGHHYDGKQVFSRFSCEIQRGDRIGVIGNNGRGKTTLLKLLAARMAPTAGKIELGYQTDLGYFPQNHEECVDKSKEMTLFDWLRSAQTGAYDQDLRSALGRMLFSGEDAFKNIQHLSGGETARLLFARIMLLPHNVLVLDEPNNHLDLESVSALADGITGYEGTVVFATHDRDLLDKAATKIIAFEEKGPVFFSGPYEEYLLSKK